MRRIPLKSRNGCIKCRERRRKCDETKPICGDCSRLGFRCQWLVPGQSFVKADRRTSSSSTIVVDVGEPVIDAREPFLSDDFSDTDKLYGKHHTLATLDSAVPHRNSITKAPAGILVPIGVDSNFDNKHQIYHNQKRPNHSREVMKIHPGHDYITSFDSPATLRTNAVPYDGTSACKQILQYLSEKGGVTLTFPAQNLPPNYKLNTFRAGFQLASHNPVLHQAYLCLGAGQLSKTHPSFETIALKYYHSVLSKLRDELRFCYVKAPAEWACAVAAVLSFYELVAFHSSESRLAHLMGYHHLVEARIHHKLSWGPLRILLEQYIHSLIVGSLFHYEILIGQKLITYVDDQIATLNNGPRPLGREIAGVPEELTSVTYRLIFLNNQDVMQSPWDAELVMTIVKLSKWTPASHALLPSGAGLLLVAELYHLACTCLLQNIIDRTANAEDELIASCLEQASILVRNMQSLPFNCMMWPLTILSIFAVDPQQKSHFKSPILKLIDTAEIKGYRSILEFLLLIESEGIGPEVLLRRDLLSMVHM